MGSAAIMLARLMLKTPSTLVRPLRLPPFSSSPPWRRQLQRLRYRQFAGTPVRGRIENTGQNSRTRGQIQPKDELQESVKPESVQSAAPPKFDGAPKTDALLAEQTVSNKEQRKADWAIMKEMSRYLWPKVHQMGRRVKLVALTLGLG